MKFSITLNIRIKSLTTTSIKYKYESAKCWNALRIGNQYIMAIYRSYTPEPGKFGATQVNAANLLRLSTANRIHWVALTCSGISARPKKSVNIGS